MSRDGVSVMATNPDPNTFWTDTGIIPILAYLIEIEPD